MVDLMRYLSWLLALSGVLAAACAPTPAPSSTPASDWPQPDFDYANTRAVTNNKISSSNIGQLGVLWTFAVSGVGKSGALATTPVVQNGTVYLQDLKDNVYAMDLQTGTLKWQKLYDVENEGPNGPALDGGKVFVDTGVLTVTALDANSGNEVWSANVPGGPAEGIDVPPIVFNGTVYVSTVPGIAAKFYSGGGMGIIYALDEQTGAVKWSFNTVKDGNLWGHPDVNSGGGAWYPPAVDTASGTTYWGIGNPAPFPGTPDYPNGSSRPGPNLYTDSEIALDNSGQLKWYAQPISRDLRDYDFEAPPILTTAMVNGASRDMVIGAGKAGYVVGFDRSTGEQLWKTSVGRHQNDNLQSYPADTPLEVYPGATGGVETPMALADGTVYVPVVNLATDFTASTFSVRKPATGAGELDAIDAATGTVLWKADLDSPDYGGATVAGDLVFTSTFAGDVQAFDRASGKQVWSWRAPGGINGFISVAGDILLVPVGLASSPQLVALKIGASATGAQPIAQPSALPTATTAPVTQSSTAQLTVMTPAENSLAFDTDTLNASAGAQVTVTYTNNSSLPHNWHLYGGTDANAQSIAETPIKAGPGDVETIQFSAPSQAGQYYFQCDVHPFMNGHLVVSPSSP